jgi:MFS family permease
MAMILLGVGIGLMMQTYTLAVQNDAKREEMGVATATTQFSRSIGGTLGVAAFGTILATRFANEVITNGHNPALSKAQVLQLSYAHSLHTVFLASVPLAVLALVLAFALKEKPLRTEAFVQANAAEVGTDVTGVPVGAEAEQEILEEELLRAGDERDEAAVSTHLL